MDRVSGHSPRVQVPVSDSSAPSAVTGMPRVLLRLERAAALAGAVGAYAALDGRWPLFALLFLVPDPSMLGYFAGPALMSSGRPARPSAVELRAAGAELLR
jgi:Domain of unknown function (DUF4260)